MFSENIGHGLAFIHKDSGQPVTVAEAARLIEQEECDDYSFLINPEYQQPSESRIIAAIDDFEVPTSYSSDTEKIIAALHVARQSFQENCYAVGAGIFFRDDCVAFGANVRKKGHPHRFFGHAENQAVWGGSAFLDEHDDQERHISMAVTLSPCPGCSSTIADCPIGTVIVASPDPENGALFAKTKADLRRGVGIARQQSLKNRSVIVRFPDIDDEEFRAHLLEVSWAIFHLTRKKVHKREHRTSLCE